MSKYNLHRESGIAIGLVMVMLTVLFIVVAFSIDLAFQATTKQEQQLNANKIALESLKSYFGANPASNLTDAQRRDQRMTAALASANSLAGSLNQRESNINFYQNVNNRQNNMSIVDSSGGAAGATGGITPGRWFDREPSGTGGCSTYCATNNCGATCPCPSNAWQGACFQPVLKTEAASAMRVQLKTDDSSKLKAIFGKFVNSTSSAFSSTAISTISPRRIVFAVDLSQSITRQNHTNGTFSLMADPRNVTGADPVSPCTGVAGAPKGDSGFWNATNTSVFNGQTVTPLIGQAQAKWNTLAVASRDQYYECIQFSNIGDETASTRGDLGSAPAKNFKLPAEANQVAAWNSPTYLIDMAYWRTGDVTRRPEPLYSIISSIYTSMIEMEDRLVAGDEIGIIFFDDSLIRSRATLSSTVAPNGGFLAGMTTAGSAEFNRVRDALKSFLDFGPSSANGMFLVPRPLGTHLDNAEPYPFNRLGAGTNLKQASRVALEMISFNSERITNNSRLRSTLNNDCTNWIISLDHMRFNETQMTTENKNARNMVIIISDMNNNCVLPSAAGNPCCDPTGSTGYAKSSWYIQDSARNVTDFPSVPIHMLAFNNFVASSSTATGGGLPMFANEGHCLNDDDLLNDTTFARLYNISGGGTAGTGVGIDRYYGPRDSPMGNTIPKYRRNAIGKVLPILPSCYPVGHAKYATCRSGALKRALDQMCATAYTGCSTGDPYYPFCRVPMNNLSIPEVASPTDLTGRLNFATGVIVGDNESHIIDCDILCRTPAEQSGDFFSPIVGDNPYRVVSPNR